MLPAGQYRVLTQMRYRNDSTKRYMFPFSALAPLLVFFLLEFFSNE